MGNMITFYDENGDDLGHASFSAFTGGRQQHAYGVSWYDCVIWVHETEGEVYGREDDPDSALPYTPDWDLCLERARRLLAGAKATDNEQRRGYDLQDYTVPKLVELLEACASNPNRDRCTITVG